MTSSASEPSGATVCNGTGELICPPHFRSSRLSISQLIRWFSDAVKAPKIKAKFAALGFIPGSQCGGDFGAIIRKDYDNYGRTIRKAHLQML